MMSKTLAAALMVALCLPAFGQSLSPMRKAGTTPTDVKGFRLTVGNPYQQRMVFEITVMDEKFEHPVGEAQVQPSELVLAPGVARQVIVAFKVPSEKERTVGVCVVPKSIAGPVIPRVCGTYTGQSLAR